MSHDPHKDDEITNKALDWQLIQRLMPIIRPQALKLTIVVVLLLLTTMTELCAVRLIGDCLDFNIKPFGAENAIRPADPRPYLNGLYWTLAGLVGFYLIQAILTYRQVNILISSGQAIIASLRMTLFTHLQRLPAAYFDQNPTGKMVTRLTNDVNNIHEAFSGVLVYLAKDFFLMVGILYVMISVSPKLALLLLIPLPFLILASMFFRILHRKAYREVRESFSRINSFLHESFSGIATIKVFVQENKLGRRFERLNEANNQANLQSIFISSLFIPIVGFLTTLPIALLIWFGGLQCLDGALTLGTIYIMLNYLRMFYEPIADFSQKYLTLQSAMASAERLFQLLDTPIAPITTRAPSASEPTQFPSPLRGHLEFRNVSFAYDPRKQILNQISFQLEPGQTLALVGDTGSGKTTLTSLLCRFYEPSEGQIILDGVDIATLPTVALRDHLAVVMQEPFLFSTTIAENISLGTPGISLDTVKRAAEAVGAAPFIERLPSKYHEELHERGSNLSTGQRQLLSFARALAHDRSLIILDEATASIDSQSEELVQRATQTLLANRTAIVVAHRLSTIRHAHKILVLRSGQIIESGNHEELMRLNGHYAGMIRKQYENPITTTPQPIILDPQPSANA